MDGFTTGGAKHGLDAALTYYIAHGTPWYALYVGKPTARHGNIIMHNWRGKHQDVEEAAEFIRDRFSDTGIDSKTRYYLAWWDERPKMSKGTPDEPASGSVVFVMATPEQIVDHREGYAHRIAGVNSEIISRLSAIESKMNEPEDEDEEPEPSQQEQLIGSILNNPMFINGLVQGIFSVFKIPQQQNNVTLAGVDTETPEINFDTDKLNAALVVLKQADPQLEDHLLKLADMAKNNTSQFNWLIKML